MMDINFINIYNLLNICLTLEPYNDNNISITFKQIKKNYICMILDFINKKCPLMKNNYLKLFTHSYYRYSNSYCKTCMNIYIDYIMNDNNIFYTIKNRYYDKLNINDILEYNDICTHIDEYISYMTIYFLKQLNIININYILLYNLIYIIFSNIINDCFILNEEEEEENEEENYNL